MRARTPAVSVLLPLYNAVATLEEALRSLVAQTFTDFEAVLVDDGSTDGSTRLAARWVARDRRFRLLRQPHQGLVAALQVGLMACRAPLVARMDADDRAHPERLAAQVAYLEAHPEVAVVGTQVEAFPARAVRAGLRRYLAWQNALLTDEDIRREIFIESPFAHPSVMFRKDAVLAVGGYQEAPWAEDYDLWLRLYLAGARFGKVPRVLLWWRERPDRLTRTDPRCSPQAMMAARAHYLACGPLRGRDAVFLWGAGIAGRKLGRALLAEGVPITAYLDIDPRKVGRTRQGRPVLPVEALPDLWRQAQRPAVIVAVGVPSARALIRQRMAAFGLAEREGRDWWFAA